MKLIIGLGNPGRKYSKNRHNVGLMVIDRLVNELRVKGFGLQQDWKESTKGKLQYYWFNVNGEKVELIRPQVFMNNSGYSIAYAYKNHPELTHDDIYIIHDDLDIVLGDYKIQKGKGPREHKGLLSIYKELKAKNFWHVRVGVENRQKMENRTSGEEYVLQNFKEDELEILSTVIDRIIKDLINKVTN